MISGSVMRAWVFSFCIFRMYMDLRAKVMSSKDVFREILCLLSRGCQNSDLEVNQ